LKNSFSVVSISGLLTFEPALNRHTSIGPISFSTLVKSAWTSDSCRASTLKA